jgi:hypothetical protein
MRELSKSLAWLAIGFSVLVPLLGWAVGHQPLHQMILTGLAMAFSVIPEELPIIITMVLALGASAMGYYFWRVTGNPFRMPYQVYQDAYDPVPVFLWQSLKPQPVYHHKLMQDLYTNWVLPQFTATRSLRTLCEIAVNKLMFLWFFYFGIVLLVPFLMAALNSPHGFAWKEFNPNTRFLLVTTGVSVAGFALEVTFLPHYGAPITCVIIALVLLAMRYGRSWRWHQQPTGLAITRAIPMVCVMLLLLRVAATPLRLPLVQSWPPWPPIWCSPGRQMLDRARIASQLQSYPGRQLAIVRYSAAHDYRREWVYNSADIDGSKVVWARDMGAAKNQELIDYFKDRRVWLVEPDEKPPRLTPYLSSGAP